MRTTIRLDDPLLREAKREASRSGMTLTAIIEEALRERLARTASAAERRSRARLPTFRGQGLAPGVDLDDSVALLDLMNETS